MAPGNSSIRWAALGILVALLVTPWSRFAPGFGSVSAQGPAAVASPGSDPAAAKGPLPGVPATAGGVEGQPPEAIWTLECTDCPRYFTALTDRSLRVDSSGLARMVYGGDRLYYAWEDAAHVWHSEVVDDTPGCGQFASLALDADGWAHVAYTGTAAGSGLMMATQSASGWAVEAVDTSGEVGYFTSIQIDSSGYAHIAYSIWDEQDFWLDLWYAYQDANGWHLEMVDDTHGYWYFSLALDPDGTPHISCFDIELGILLYATRDPGPPAAWQVTDVDFSSDTGHYSSIAVDNLGHPHISYQDYTYGTLQHAWHDGASWRTETVATATSGAVWLYTSIAVDSAGRPHITYHSYAGGIGQLSHAVKDVGGWTTEVVQGSTAGRTGLYTSVDLDASDRLHVGYYDARDGGVKYAYQDGAGWHTDIPIDGGADAGQGLALAVDRFGYEHISYLRFHDQQESGYLAHTFQDLFGWHSEVVDAGATKVDYTSIALDDGGGVHISYFDRASNDLKYAFRAPDGWHLGGVDGAGGSDAGYGSSLAADGGGRPHISYYAAGGSADALRYAVYDGSTWQIETVATGLGSQARYYGTSLRLDGNGRPHITYYDSAAQDLLYAWHNGTAWQFEIADSAGNVGQYSSLALDTSGRPHVSYYDSTTQDLNYAYRDGSGWHTTTVDAGGASLVGKYSSLALDSLDRPAISYNDSTGAALRFARWSGSAWSIEVVDPDGGQRTSLGLDRADQPHIAHYDNVMRDLRLAFVPGAIVERAVYLPAVFRNH